MGALEDLESHGRFRLIPYFANSELATIDDRNVRDWLARLYRSVEAGDAASRLRSASG